MKELKIFALAALIVVFFAVNLMANGWGSGPGYEMNHNPTMGNDLNMGPQSRMNLAAQFPYQALSEEERVGLLEMRSEEKLARDVYLALYNTWHQEIFLNNANAEQIHMENIKNLLDKYGIADPVTDYTPGVFTAPHLNELYQMMVTKGMTSFENALMVGANIEDMGIFNMNRLIAQADNDDIQAVFQNSNRSSRNHLRSFSGMMGGYGMVYTPQYLTQNEMDEIMSIRWE